MRFIRRAFVIGNGIAGAENQCIGLVQVLGLSHRQTLFRTWSPKCRFGNLFQFLLVSIHKRIDNALERAFQYQGSVKRINVVPVETERTDILEADADKIAALARESFERDGPILVVASGWDTISISSSIRQLAPENVFVVQIQHPHSRLDRFDLVITPRHDYYLLTPQGREQVPWFLRRWITSHEPPEKHVVLSLGALHRVNPTSLQTAASMWHDEFAPLAKPLLVVNIGGPTSHCKYGVDLAKQLIASLINVLPSCGSVRISFSRRTPPKICETLIEEFDNHPKVYIWDGKEPNPHMGHLAWANAFVVTADSVSMLSEACSTGKPVYVIGAERCTCKFADFQNSLQDRGAVRSFSGQENISESWSYSPLNDTAEAASHVIDALAERGWEIQP